MTALTIADGTNAMYAALTMPKKSDTTADERSALRKRVEAGEWLRIGDAAKVLNLSRSKVDLMIRAGTLGYQLVPGSRYREVDPDDILTLLTGVQQTRRPKAAPPTPETPAKAAPAKAAPAKAAPAKRS